MPRTNHALAAGLLVALVTFILGGAAGCATPSLRDAEPFPDGRFSAYTGSARRAGDYGVRVSEYTNPESGRTVVLVPMVHLGEPSFYLAVQEEMDRADVVLMEGVGGPASLSPYLAVKEYVFSNMERYTSHLGLVGQGEVLRAGANWEAADLPLAELERRAPWYTPVTQALLLPFLVVAGEPTNLVAALRDAADVFRAPASSSDVAERHFVAKVLDDDEDDGEDDTGDILLPGLLTWRNEALLEHLDRVAVRDGAERIVVPWGAAHMPGIESGLLARGYEPGARRWLTVIRVRGLLDPTGDDGDAGHGAGQLAESHFQLPYLLHWRSVGEAWSVHLAAGSIAHESRHGGSYRTNLLWDLLLTWRSDPEHRSTGLTLLPFLFGRPLLLDWQTRGDATRVRALLFLEF